jgi:hypothetical protein
MLTLLDLADSFSDFYLEYVKNIQRTSKSVYLVAFDERH